jgi:hypothetical protein
MVDIMTRHPSFAKKPSRSQFADVEPEEDIENIPEEERFDWKTISSICIAGNAKHRAYGASFGEYVRNRSHYVDSDENEKSRLSFYMPRFESCMSSDLASILKLSSARFLNHIIEIGLITMMVDYHDQIEIIKHSRSAIMTSVVNKESQQAYMYMTRLPVTLGSSCGARRGESIHHAPTVPIWLYNAIGDVSTYLNMAMSDVVLLCWVLGYSKSLEPEYRNIVMNENIKELVEHFDMEINLYTRSIDMLTTKKVV